MPVAFVSRYSLVTERRAGPLTKLVAAVAWAVRRLRRYTTFAEELVVTLPTRAECLLVMDVECNMRLRAAVVDL